MTVVTFSDRVAFYSPCRHGFLYINAFCRYCVDVLTFSPTSVVCRDRSPRLMRLAKLLQMIKSRDMCFGVYFCTNSTVWHFKLPLINSEFCTLEVWHVYSRVVHGSISSTQTQPNPPNNWPNSTQPNARWGYGPRTQPNPYPTKPPYNEQQSTRRKTVKKL